MVLVHFLHLLKLKEQFSSGAVFHDENDEHFGFKGMFQLYNILVVYFRKDVPFVLNNAFLFIVLDELLGDELHCEELSVDFPHDQVHVTESL